MLLLLSFASTAFYLLDFFIFLVSDHCQPVPFYFFTIYFFFAWIFYFVVLDESFYYLFINLNGHVHEFGKNILKHFKVRYLYIEIYIYTRVYHLRANFFSTLLKFELGY